MSVHRIGINEPAGNFEKNPQSANFTHPTDLPPKGVQTVASPSEVLNIFKADSRFADYGEKVGVSDVYEQKDHFIIDIDGNGPNEGDVLIEKKTSATGNPFIRYVSWETHKSANALAMVDEMLPEFVLQHWTRVHTGFSPAKASAIYAVELAVAYVVLRFVPGLAHTLARSVPWLARTIGFLGNPMVQSALTALGVPAIANAASGSMEAFERGNEEEGYRKMGATIRDISLSALPLVPFIRKMFGVERGIVQATALIDDANGAAKAVDAVADARTAAQSTHANLIEDLTKTPPSVADPDKFEAVDLSEKAWEWLAGLLSKRNRTIAAWTAGGVALVSGGYAMLTDWLPKDWDVMENLKEKSRTSLKTDYQQKQEQFLNGSEAQAQAICDELQQDGSDEAIEALKEMYRSISPFHVGSKGKYIEDALSEIGHKRGWNIYKAFRNNNKIRELVTVEDVSGLAKVGVSFGSVKSLLWVLDEFSPNDELHGIALLGLLQGTEVSSVLGLAAISGNKKLWEQQRLDHLDHNASRTDVLYDEFERHGDPRIGQALLSMEYGTHNEEQRKRIRGVLQGRRAEILKNQDFTDLYFSAKQATNAKEKIALYRLALEATGNRDEKITALLSLVHLYREAGHLNLALRALFEIRRIDAGHPGITYEIVDLLMHFGQLQAAKKILQEAMGQESQESQGSKEYKRESKEYNQINYGRRLGQIHKWLGETDAAILQYKDVLRKNLQLSGISGLLLRDMDQLLSAYYSANRHPDAETLRLCSLVPHKLQPGSTGPTEALTVRLETLIYLEGKPMDAWELAVQFFNRSDRINSPEAYDIFQKHFLNLTLQLFHDDPVKLKVAKEVFEREMNVSPLRKGVHSTRLNFSLLRVKLALNETDGIRELSSDRSWEKSTQHTRDPETTKAYVVAQARIAADEQDPAVAEEAIQEIHRILKQYPPLGVLGPVWEMEIRREVGAELLKSPLTTYAGLDLME